MNIPRTILSSLIILVIFLVSLPNQSQSQSYKPPEKFVQWCIILSPIVASVQISGALNFGAANSAVDKIATMDQLFDLLTNGPLTPQKCRDLLPDTKAEYDQYHFQKDLKNCDKIKLEDRERWIAGAKTFDGVLFCDTQNFEQWQRFRDFILSEENDEAAKLWEEITDAPIFEPVPEFNLSNHIGKESNAHKECLADAEDDGRTIAVRRCLVEETARHDLILNSSYQCLKEKLPESDFLALRQVQRAWNKEKDNKCAHDPNGGTMAVDISANCYYEQTQTKAAELAVLAIQKGCPYINIDDLAPDRDKWWSSGDSSSVSNQDGMRIEIQCDGSASGKISAKSIEDITAFSLREPLNFRFLDSAGKQTALVGLRVGGGETSIDFPVTEYVLKQFRAASSVEITDRIRSATFSLSGSSAALEGCNITQKPRSNTSTATNLLPAPRNQQQQKASGMSRYNASTRGIYITLPGDLPVKIRCDRPFPEAYLQETGLLNRLFGAKVKAGDLWSFETVSRAGKTIGKIPVEAVQLADGVGFPLSAKFLWDASDTATLFMSSNGKEHSTAISAESDKIKSCFRTSAHELQRFLLGEWQRPGGLEGLNFTTDPVGTAFGTWARLEYTDRSGRIARSFHWNLGKNSALHININTFVCEVLYDPMGLKFRNMFDCRLQGTWTRKQN